MLNSEYLLTTFSKLINRIQRREKTHTAVSREGTFSDNRL